MRERLSKTMLIGEIILVACLLPSCGGGGAVSPDFSQRNPENRDKANPTASQRRFGIGHIRNSMLPHHSLAVPCIISIITIFNLRW